MARLSDPDVRFQRSFLAAMEEFAEEGRAGDDSMLGRDLARHRAAWDTPSGFEEYVETVRATSTAEPPPGWVRSTTWWWTEGEEYVGRVNLRHELTPGLLEVGGHIGYDVRPTRRREGHATAMLAAVLPLAARRGIDRALLTCDHDNVGSRRVIEAGGGVLEDRRGHKLRFWVPTS